MGKPTLVFQDCTESHRRNEGIYTLTLPSIIPRFPNHLEMNSLHPMNPEKQAQPVRTFARKNTNLRRQV